ncbi:hypothetical protein KL86CLO1_11821 [uncultured Eubacteriales bacterium]|uniref:Uncharacterized protein n=1 Tax=uncultured Eubacteriales bacterium TaxID=172733 RepID=A0A212JWT7_9FIRM|nr:hypothetical protein KL86CLO1_11821 [uncultured Eubacteriales bacterium]
MSPGTYCVRGGGGFNSPIPESCGPLTELEEEIKAGTADSVSTFP